MKLTFKDLKKAKKDSPSIEFLGHTWRIAETNLIELEELLDAAKGKAESLAIEKLKTNKKSLESQEANLERFERLNESLAEDTRLAPPKNAYEEKLNKWKGIYYSGLIAIGLLETSDGQALSEIATKDSEIREVLSAFANTPGLMTFINNYVASWSAPEKNG